MTMPIAPRVRRSSARKRDFREGRHDRQGQGAADRVSGCSSATARSSTPICISLPIRPRPGASSTTASRPWPMRPSPTSAAGCRCSRRCPKSRPPLHPGGRHGAAEGQWRARHPARRRARRAAGQGHRRRRRCGGAACGAHGRWPRRRRHHPRPLHPAPAPAPTTSSAGASTRAILPSTRWRRRCFSADLVIGAVLIPGAAREARDARNCCRQ